MEEPKTLAAALRDRLRASPGALPTSGFTRLWKTGVGAATLGASVLGGRLRGRDGSLEAADLADVAALATRLGELKGVAMKAGQILGYVDATLPTELREVLSVLQTQAQPSPFEAVEATLREALGAAAPALLATMERTPISVASIGQVHRARLAEGTEVAVKVRHPGIEAAIRNDFRAAGAGATFARAFVPGAASAVEGFVGEARAALLEECDLSLEARRQTDFARRYAGDPDVVIPAVQTALCAPSVLVTAWTPGRSLDAFLASSPTQAQRDRLGRALFRFYVGGLYRDGLFHADPHPGNFAVLGDGRLVIYDFGCVRSFTPNLVRSFAALAAATRDDDADAMRDALRAIGAEVPDGDASFGAARALLRGFFAPLLVEGPRRMEPGAGIDTSALLADKRTLLGLKLPGELLFLFRLRFGLYAVLARLGAVADWSALEGQFAAGHVSPRESVRREDRVSASSW